MNYNFYLIDDDISVISILSKIIVNQKLGDVVGKDTTGEKAVQEIKKLKPDIVIVDLLLPKIDGFAVLKKIKKEPSSKNIPVIILTNLGEKGDIEKGKKLGAIDYLVKINFTPKEVIEKINTYLE